MDPAASNIPDDHHRAAVSVVGSTRAVERHRPPELGDQQYRYRGSVTNIFDECGHTTGELTQQIRHSSGGGALREVRVPPAALDERHPHTEVRFDKPGELFERVRFSTARVLHPVARRLRQRIAIANELHRAEGILSSICEQSTRVFTVQTLDALGQRVAATRKRDFAEILERHRIVGAGERARHLTRQRHGGESSHPH